MTAAPAARARSCTGPGAPRPTLTTRAPAASPASTSSGAEAAAGAGGGFSGTPSSHRSGASAVRGSVPRGSGGVGAATRTLTAIGDAVRAHARSTASDAASALMPLRPKAPSPPASETAATSSGVVGPPAMPASSTGWRIPSSAQSRFAKGGSVSARDIRVPKSQARHAGTPKEGTSRASPDRSLYGKATRCAATCSRCTWPVLLSRRSSPPTAPSPRPGPAVSTRSTDRAGACREAPAGPSGPQPSRREAGNRP